MMCSEKTNHPDTVRSFLLLKRKSTLNFKFISKQRLGSIMDVLITGCDRLSLMWDVLDSSVFFSSCRVRRRCSRLSLMVMFCFICKASCCLVLRTFFSASRVSSWSLIASVLNVCSCFTSVLSSWIVKRCVPDTSLALLSVISRN